MPHPDPGVPVILRQFAYPLPKRPEYTALYAVIATAHGPQLEWRGIARIERIPAPYNPPEHDQRGRSIR